MELEIAKSTFARALSLTQGVVEKRNTMPVLSNVLIEAGQDSISVLATDLEVGIRRTCEGTVKEPGTITVQAKKLYEIVHKAPSELIRIKSADGTSIEVTSGRARFKLVGIDPSQFPKLPGLDGARSETAATMRANPRDLGIMIERSLFAVSTDDTRINLSGVYMEPHEGLLRMVATDGHRLAMIDREVGGDLPEKGAILPRKGLAEMKKVIDDAEEGEEVHFQIEGSMARLTCGRSELFMSLVEGEFPNYNQVIPKEGKVQVSVPRSAMLAALGRVSLLSSERTKGVRITLRSGTMEVATQNPDMGEATEEIEIEYTGDEVTVGFNARYLIDALGVLPDDTMITLSVTDSVSPGILRTEADESYLYVVMPMRL